MLLAPLVAPATAHAENPHDSRVRDAGPSAVDVAQGKHHFALAQEHYRARRFREALHELELAYAKVPSPELLFNLARTHEQVGETELAIARYREYLETVPESADAQNVREHVRELARSQEAASDAVARAGLRVDSNRDGARVVLDGAPVGETPLEALRWVEPGAHQLEVTRAGDRPFRAELQLAAGSVAVAYADMTPRAIAPMPAEPAPVATPVWIAAGVSACALLAGGTLAWAGERERQAGDSAAADGYATGAGAAFTTAIGTAIVAAVIYAVAPEEETARAERPASMP